VSGNRRIQSWTWLPLAAVLALVSVGCAETNSAGSAPEAGAGGMNGDASFEGAGGAGAEGGAGEPVRFDGTLGVTDNPVDQLFANPQRNPWDALGSDAEAAATYSDAAQTCYASVDACGGAECEAFASCCVNTGACCAPIVVDPPLPGLLDFQKCAGQTAEGCAEGVGSSAVTFGELEPVLSGRGLVPNGTATAEGGAVIGDLLNLSSQRVEVDVRFTLPVGCAGTCLESAGVAFTGSAPDAFVDAEVGLLLSGSREVVSLMIGNAVADSFDAGTDSTQWRLSLSPEGAAQVFRDGNLQGAYSFDAAALNQAQFVVFGRNLGAATTSAAIAAIGVEVSSCDNPQAWTERRPASITLDGNEVPGHASGSGPSLVDQGVRKRMAYEVDGEIFVSEQEAPGEFFLSDSIPALMPTVGSIGAALSVQDLPVFTKADGPTLVPTGDDVVSYDAPSVVYRDGLWLLVVRATLSDGATELRAFYTSDIDTGWERVVSGALEPLTHVDDPTSEVTDPSLIVHNSAYHLYYARRTGTRWSVELAVSDELVLWRSMGEVLGGSGEGFDSLGARSLDALSQPDRIDIVYSGQDGVSFQLGTASRAAPSDTAPSFF